MTNNLKIEVMVSNIPEDGSIASQFPSQEYVNQQLAKKANLSPEGRLDPSHAPDYTEIPGLYEHIEDTKDAIETSIADSLQDAKGYTNQQLSTGLQTKADLVNGKIPFDQIPFSADIEDQIQINVENITAVVDQKVAQVVEQVNGVATAANSYTDTKVAETKTYVDTTVGNVIEDVERFGVSKAVTIPTYTTPESGVAAGTGVAAGAYFNVRSTEDDTMLVEYQNIGGVPTPSGGEYPSSVAVRNIAKYTALPFVTGETYGLHERVQLENGDRVQSTVSNNIIDPNVDMTGWKPSKDKGVITTVESIADLVTIQNPKDGDVVNVKSYYKATNFALLNPFKGGGERVYVESLKTTNNHGTIISGWVATNVSEHTPEAWGAYGDNEHDDTEALNNMFKTLQPYPTGSSVSRSQITNLLNYCKKYTVRALGVYKTSNTVYIPCGITWIQPIDGRWNWSVEIGINYQPQAVNYNKPAIATIAYQYNNDNADLSLGTYTFIDDIFFKPTAADFDNGKFITLGWSVDLQGLAVQTHKDVTLGVFLNGFFGKTNGLSVGVASHPKVGVVTNLGWNAQHDYMFVTASQQAIVFHGVCTYNTLNNPLFNCRNDAVKTTSITPPFKPVDVNTTGTIGITNDQSILNINSLCYQSWTIGVANVNGSILNINNPYFESLLCKYEYYNSASTINGSLCGYFGGYFYDDVINDLDGSAVPFKRSALYVKDMTNNKVKLSGDARFGVWRWIDGINSDNSVHLDLAGFSATWGKLGNIGLLSSLNLHGQETLYVNSETGDDENFGLSDNKPLKTLRNIFKMGVFGADKTIIYKDITVSNVAINLPDKMDFTAQPADKSIDIILDNGRFVFSKNCNVAFNGFTLSSTAEHGTYCFYATTENTIANLKIFGDVNVNQNLIYSPVNSEIDLTVVGGYVVMPKYLQVADGKHSRFGVTVDYNSAPPNPMTQGNVLLKYKYPLSLT